MPRVVLAELTQRAIQKAIDDLSKILSKLDDRGFGEPLAPTKLIVPTSIDPQAENYTFYFDPGSSELRVHNAENGTDLSVTLT